MRKFRQRQHVYRRHNPRVKNLCYEVTECARKRSESELIGRRLAGLLDALHVRLLVLVKAHTRECKAFQDVWEESRRTATAEEVKRGIVAESDTRALDSSSSSTDVQPGVATDVENSADRMDEDTSLRAPAISHPLEPDAEEHVFQRRLELLETYFTLAVKTS